MAKFRRMARRSFRRPTISRQLPINEMRVTLEKSGLIRWLQNALVPLQSAFVFTMWSGGDQNTLNTDHNRIYSQTPEYQALSQNFAMIRVTSMALEVTLTDSYTTVDQANVLTVPVVGGTFASGGAGNFPDVTPPTISQLQSLDRTKLVAPSQGINKAYIDCLSQDKLRGLPQASTQIPRQAADAYLISILVQTVSDPPVPGPMSTAGMYVAKWNVMFSGRRSA